LKLETGFKQGPAIGLYEAIGYQRVVCWGDYAGDPTSVCFEKVL
jgi:putative acetyltransferase